MKVPITKPYFTQEDIEAIQQPLKTGWVVQGPYVKELENKFCSYTGARFSVAMNSCTSAQFVASRCIGLKPGDEVIVPSFTWISTANAAEFTGAKPVFVDIDLDTFNIDVNKLENKINSKTKAIFPVNLFGLAADMEKIMTIAEKYSLKVIEDSACGLGARIKDKHCGTFGDCGCFSMHPRKSITSGEGGILITDNEKLAKMACALRDHGADRTDLERHDQKESFLLPEYKYMGYNFRLTDIQGALGSSQFNKLDDIIKKRRNIAGIYDKELKGTFLSTPLVPAQFVHSYQSYVCIYKYEKLVESIKEQKFNIIDVLNEERNKFMLKLEERGIATRQGTHAVHIQEYYKEKYNIGKFDYPFSYAADRLTVSLPIYPQMTEEEQEYVIENIREVSNG
ncbi:DegT/DnrJ/EryC1/StrS family aminotransferase [Candidatus Atribacteria bacterium HGW-Atribacteria-1]|nr:MAG: DegT/DnrJ/EryC1/StrS family aminotransferase [Candidatus Atribacteria bacterium HGW-Atribacteria-1]